MYWLLQVLVIIHPLKSTLLFVIVMASVAGLSAYVRLYDSKYYGFDWSYFVGWVGVFFVSVAVVLIIIGIERRKHLVH